MHRIPESQVVAIWQKRLLRRRRFTAGTDEVEVVYTGRRNDDRGADFRDAVITSGQRVVRGHIEIHAKSSDWQAHRHHLDPVYNQVVLHVAFSHDAKVDTIRQDGESVPTVVLNESVSRNRSNNLLDQRTVMRCVEMAKNRRKELVVGYLNKAGDERFQNKADRFYTDLAQTEADQCLFAGIMGALGYIKNKAPFLELARRVPLRLLQSAAWGDKADEDYAIRVQALLMGGAGLLPSQRPAGHCNDVWADRLENLWSGGQQPSAMSYTDWHLFKVRPCNFPVRRIAAMSYLLSRYRKKGLFEGMLGAVAEAADSKDCACMERALMVKADGYWASHFDFGSGGRTPSPILLGSERAGVITVNVLLPFAYAWNRIKASSTSSMQVIELYRHHPRLPLNAVERHMIGQLGLNGSMVNSARRQQGLIHIYNTLCTQGRCDQCPLRSGYSGI